MSVIGQRMKSYLPKFYETSRISGAIMDSQGTELDQLRLTLDELLQQSFVGTATWGLDIWEKQLGIKTDPTKPVSERRSNIVSKIRGTGTVTIELLQNVAQSFDHGTIEVTQQPALYQFTVHFVDTLGLPPNIDDVKAAIEEIKPAHLSVQYSFRYLTLLEVGSLTINQIQNHPLTDFAPFLDA